MLIDTDRSRSAVDDLDPTLLFVWYVVEDLCGTDPT